MVLPQLENFFGKLKEQNYSEDTIYNYKRDLDLFGNYLNEQYAVKKLGDINISILENFKIYLSSTERVTSKNQVISKILSVSSINRVLSSVKSYFKYLSDNNILHSLQYTKIKLHKNFRKNIEIPKLEEVLKLIESPDKFETEKIVKLRNRAMLEVLFATGLSISELLSLKIDQMDSMGKIGVILNNKKQHVVYLTTRAMECLQKYLKTRNDDSPFMFIPYRGRNNQEKFKKISNNYLQFKIKQYRELLSIDSTISANSLRQGFFIYLNEYGANPAAIQILLGHESLDTTTRYVHASDKYAEKVHTKFHPLKD